jgi:hypothetical protein
MKKRGRIKTLLCKNGGEQKPSRKRNLTLTNVIVSLSVAFINPTKLPIVCFVYCVFRGVKLKENVYPLTVNIPLSNMHIYAIIQYNNNIN